MAGISSLGVGSGLDLQGMLDQLKKAEQTRLNPYTKLKKSYEAKISSWGLISGSLSGLKKTVLKLQGDAFNTLNASSSDAFTATATSSASADSHSVTVTRMATAHKIKTDTFASADTNQGNSAGERTITITQGNGKEIKVTLADDETSLNQIAKAINKQGGDVQATVQRTDKGYQLMLSAKTTGSDGKISVDVQGDAQLAGILNTSQGGQVGDQSNGDKMISVTQAQDAKLIVDGSTYTRSSNSISDIIEGVTLNLKAVSKKENGEFIADQLTLTKDNSAVKSAVQEFIKQYNELLTQTSAASKFTYKDAAGLADDEVAQQSSDNGALMGDSMLRGLVSEVRAVVNGVYGDADADYSALADLGITIDTSTGQMTLNEARLDEAIADAPEQIAQIFQDRNGKEGLASRLKGIITDYIGDQDSKAGGRIKNTTDGLNDQVDLVKTQIDKMQKIIDASVERYRIQFQQLDKTMSQMSSMSNALMGLLQTLK